MLDRLSEALSPGSLLALEREGLCEPFRKPPYTTARERLFLALFETCLERTRQGDLRTVGRVFDAVCSCGSVIEFMDMAAHELMGDWAEWNPQNKILSPLHRLAQNPERDYPADSVRALFALCPNLLDIRDEQDRTPLHAAVQCGNVRMTRLLLEAGCDPHLQSPSGNPLQSLYRTLAPWEGRERRFVDEERKLHIAWLLRKRDCTYDQPERDGDPAPFEAHYARCAVSGLYPDLLEFLLEDEFQRGMALSWRYASGRPQLNGTSSSESGDNLLHSAIRAYASRLPQAPDHKNERRLYAVLDALVGIGLDPDEPNGADLSAPQLSEQLLPTPVRFH